ncbi:hypothetical protein AB0937_35395 [Streptomyces sp. NPDC047880]|uniref:SbtR family transcriptional regulator n=1 Tax=Streptomyces sp. NPDC047880 TaxID=3155626 RepID=UPI003452BC6C
MGADPVERDAEARAGTALAALIQAGQADDDVHQDVTVDDIYLLFSTAPTDQPPTARARWLTLVLTGLTTHEPETPGLPHNRLPSSRSGQVTVLYGRTDSPARRSGRTALRRPRCTSPPGQGAGGVAVRWCTVPAGRGHWRWPGLPAALPAPTSAPPRPAPGRPPALAASPTPPRPGTPGCTSVRP